MLFHNKYSYVRPRNGHPHHMCAWFCFTRKLNKNSNSDVCIITYYLYVIQGLQEGESSKI